MATDRKLEILDATCRVIAREGADGLRMGTVAREAGVSTALLHYYFDTRADLLMQAFDHADVKADEAAMAALAGIPRAVDRLERLLLIYAGADAVFRDDWVLWVEMWRSAIFDERLAESVRRSSDGWMEQITDLIEQARAEGSLRGDVDVDAAARRLAAVVDGLGLQILSGVLTHERAAELILGALTVELGIPAKARSSA
jgi:AcrR family transcriptional regulator